MKHLDSSSLWVMLDAIGVNSLIKIVKTLDEVSERNTYDHQTGEIKLCW